MDLKSPKSNVKRCSSCKLELDVDEFAKRASARDGRQNACKSCQSVQRRSSYERAYALDGNVPESIECLLCGEPTICGLDNPYWLNQYSDDMKQNYALCGERCHEHLMELLARMEHLLGLGAATHEFYPR